MCDECERTKIQAVLPRKRHELMVDALEMFADDVNAGIRQKVVNVGDAARN